MVPSILLLQQPWNGGNPPAGIRDSPDPIMMIGMTAGRFKAGFRQIGSRVRNPAHDKAGLLR
jgi:hypothetical protein